MSNWKSILQNRLRCRISLSVDDGNAWYEANVSDNVVIILLTLAVPKLIAIADVCSDVNLGVALWNKTYLYGVGNEVWVMRTHGVWSMIVI